MEVIMEIKSVWRQFFGAQWILITLILCHSASTFFPDLKGEIPNPDDSCFCQLQGAIDDCTCQIDTVDHFNNFKIYPRLRSLLLKDYFRYFEVNLRKPCPFWSDDSTCSMEFCQVKACRDDEVPKGLKGQRSSFVQPAIIRPGRMDNVDDCTGEDLGYINTTISQESQQGFQRWKAYDEALVDFCTVREDDVDPGLQYVDLLLNPERFTGYQGKSAHRVWSSIYNENCFRNNLSSSKNVVEPFNSTPKKTEETCIEKRTFYRAISGLHTSINIHLSAKYLLTDPKRGSLLKPNAESQWGANLTEFQQHFDMKRSNGESSQWLKNLYFVYLLELKAIWKMSNFLRSFDLYTGHMEEDLDVKTAIADLLRVIEGFPSHFEEKALFSRKDAKKLKAEFHSRFTNITKIMDCVGCQKCKLWGKIQIKGLGTALKILFAESSSIKKANEFLTRNEIVSLLNGFGRLSESIFELENFRVLMKLDETRKSGRLK